jgi:hypothetical protein
MLLVMRREFNARMRGLTFASLPKTVRVGERIWRLMGLLKDDYEDSTGFTYEGRKFKGVTVTLDPTLHPLDFIFDYDSH